ncbi:hypothetical protein SAMN02745216_00189 [Desulfatibacillum alkenivorans DSM 16219]|jgi:hypothetical protein|uniref:Uncharacterized protein n=1 Tax=Desulfatibacillum alkenivorans DSM 16219 TaxID=1121393 RepID=A0A1M6C9S4_9BACT|nr:hypothetical protein [Desulfatibacillum alkenivorans]SHI57780.1 hypothetical protein SAMN02745216_00189 [Desulfatibacillum alkenivorans DSM 16219]
MLCQSCKRETPDDDGCQLNGKWLCEKCAWKQGLFPLSHTGARRDKISERGRVLTPPEPAGK